MYQSAKKIVIAFLLLAPMSLIGCTGKKEPRIHPTDQEIQRINDLRVTIVKFHEKWEQLDARHW